MATSNKDRRSYEAQQCVVQGAEKTRSGPGDSKLGDRFDISSADDAFDDFNPRWAPDSEWRLDRDLPLDFDCF